MASVQAGELVRRALARCWLSKHSCRVNPAEGRHRRERNRLLPGVGGVVGNSLGGLVRSRHPVPLPTLPRSVLLSLAGVFRRRKEVRQVRPAVVWE